MRKTLGKLNTLALRAEGVTFQTWGSNISCNVTPKKPDMNVLGESNLVAKRKANQEQQMYA